MSSIGDGQLIEASTPERPSARPPGGSMAQLRYLGERFCRLRTALPGMRTDCGVALWLGALGPFFARCGPEDPSGRTLLFDSPLPAAIVAHFGPMLPLVRV